MYEQDIINKTRGEIRSLLDELANGTSRYKSLNSLTEQVEHQYHGRFLIELIQNAHDALFEREEGEDQRRIAILLDVEEGSFGTLYVANDGRPFSARDFSALSNLGQSDKDPNKAIGNKGIGFRSVLEICRAPEIYSRADVETAGFGGYCFRFSPSVTEMFVEPILRLLEGDGTSFCPLDLHEQLIHWETSRLRAFRSLYGSKGREWLRGELALLSPYALPLPLGPSVRSATVTSFEQCGFATVIRLPLLEKKAQELAREKIGNLDRNAVLFLDRLNLLRIGVGSDTRSYQRKTRRRPGDTEDGIEVSLLCETTIGGQEETSLYWLWDRKIGGDSDPQGAEEIKEVVSGLPGKWPEMTEATVSIAVLVGEQPESGVTNIYLPTEVPSGSGAHLNAPFYGDMSRTTVDFGKPINALLLRKITEKAVDVVLNALAGKGHEESAALLDILAPYKVNGEERWWGAVQLALIARRVDIKKAPICMTDNGWHCLEVTKVLPDLATMALLKNSLVRSYATFPVFAPYLSTRESRIVSLLKILEINSLPAAHDLANTIEQIAQMLLGEASKADWNGFWHDVEQLLPNDNWRYLREKKILLGTDNQLHASGTNSPVFFRPLRSGVDEEIQSDEIEDVPPNIRPFMAFLGDAIETHVKGEKGQLQTTATHAYLSRGLVSRFGVEEILRTVLLPVIPELPISLKSEKGSLCGDVLRWGLRLVENLEGERTLDLMGRIPAPCTGGWYPLRETSFGPGWMGTAGRHVQTYLKTAGTVESKEAMRRLLLGPKHPNWGGRGDEVKDLLIKAGTIDGLRLKVVGKNEWDSKFPASKWMRFEIPARPPLCFSERIWGEYREYVNTKISSGFWTSFEYQMQDIYAIPGLNRYEELPAAAKVAFMWAILASIGEWAKIGKWDSAVFRKLSGQDHSPETISPLAFSLRELPWLAIENDDGIHSFRPRDRWYIPTLAGSRHQYDHLRPLTLQIVTYLERRRLVPVLTKLGMPSFAEDILGPDTRLLEALATALIDPSLEISNKDIFIGQVRSAWGSFQPGSGVTAPMSLVVRNSIGEPAAVKPSEEIPVYLPDAESSALDAISLPNPVIVIEVEDAKRLKSWFQQIFGRGVQMMSDLAVVPMAGGARVPLEAGMPLADSWLDWLPPVVLSVFAYAGAQKGTGTKSFREAMGDLRKVKVLWTENLKAGLWRGDNCVAMPQVPALWDAKSKILVCSESCRERYSDLAEALAATVGRSDIVLSLRFVLDKLNGNKDPSHDEIVAAMREIRISEDRYSEVRHKWLGDLSWVIRLLKPLVLSLQPAADLAALSEVVSEDQLLTLLERLDLSRIDGPKAMEMVRRSSTISALGRELFENVDASVQLDRWNETLGKLGEHFVKNENAEQEFQQHVGEAKTPLRSVIRYLIRHNPHVGMFRDLDGQLSSIECPHDFENRFWVVPFHQVMTIVAELFRGWGVGEDIIFCLNSATDIRGFHDQLNDLGLEPDRDPVAIHAENVKSLKNLLEIVQKAAIVWCIRNEVDSGVWENTAEELMENFMGDELAHGAFLDVWDERSCLEVICSLPRADAQNYLWTVLEGSGNLKDILDGLNLSENDLSQADEQLEARRRILEKKKQMVDVGGRTFRNTEDNLSNLWDHLMLQLGEEQIPNVDLGIYEQMDDLESDRKRKPERKESKKSGKKSGRPSQAMKDLLGLAGEMLAYRALQKTFGADVVNPACWRSGNSRYKYPVNEINDNLGCDFVITKDGRTYYIEVKATQSNDEAFELGSSEVELAIDKATRKKESFRILHVVNALSEAPYFRLLPNPYDSRFAKKYKFEGTGLRVRYRVAQTA